MTSAEHSGAYLVKFFEKSVARSACVLLKSALSAHELEGSSSSDGTPGHESGKGRPKTASVCVSTFASSPEWMASTMARVYLSGQRFPLAPPTWLE